MLYQASFQVQGIHTEFCTMLSRRLINLKKKKKMVDTYPPIFPPHVFALRHKSRLCRTVKMRTRQEATEVDETLKMQLYHFLVIYIYIHIPKKSYTLHVQNPLPTMKADMLFSSIFRKYISRSVVTIIECGYSNNRQAALITMCVRHPHPGDGG